MKKWAMIIDVAKCENCNNCFLSCKHEHIGNDFSGLCGCTTRTQAPVDRSLPYRAGPDAHGRTGVNACHVQPV